jgi:hypothetical protein
MIKALFSSFAIASLGAYAQDTSAPGRAIFWTPGSATDSHDPVYNSQSTTVNQLSEILSNQAAQKELLVIFCADDEKSSGFYTQSAMTSSIKQSDDATVFPYVYHAMESATQNICTDILASDSLKDVSTVSLSEIGSILASKSADLLNNGVLDTFLVSVPAADADMVSSVYSQIDSSAKSLFVALQNPSGAAPAKRGNYRRILGSLNEDGVDYLPEGCEFSIYKQNTYLYLTPDIFTGLMTMLFVFFVLLTGYRCLGDIQGPSTFASQLPALGKEG